MQDVFVGIGKEVPLIFDIRLDNYVYLFWILYIQNSRVESAPYAKVQARQGPHKAPPTWGQGKGSTLLTPPWMLDDMETRRPPAVSTVMQIIKTKKIGPYVNNTTAGSCVCPLSEWV